MNWFRGRKMVSLDKKDKEFAEAALKQIFVKGMVIRIKSDGPDSFYLYFSLKHPSNQSQPWLHIEDPKWTVFDQAVNFHEKTITIKENTMSIDSLLNEEVVDIWLGENMPHLYVAFQTGKILSVNGSHEMYECWQAGDGYRQGEEEWLIAAVPGNRIAYWTP
ncbi:hypothetical protein [Cytobacillus firmus]|uniref:Uncharacterized protein n=1 Tax=Cytobacillus firmus TaxID=1399 RepID=A0AA46P006_CYTFI|nr:hypothetical protein [Cytobacillus firmus]UYG93722.1 hypothetical protein OD459_16095 [Cytobacillus firmus]